MLGGEAGRAGGGAGGLGTLVVGWVLAGELDETGAGATGGFTGIGATEAGCTPTAGLGRGLGGFGATGASGGLGAVGADVMEGLGGVGMAGLGGIGGLEAGAPGGLTVGGFGIGLGGRPDMAFSRGVPGTF